MFQPSWQSRHIGESFVTSLSDLSVRMDLWPPKYLKSKPGGCEKLVFSKSFYRWKIIGKFPQWSPYQFQHYFHITCWRPFHNQIHFITVASYYSMSLPFVLPSLKHLYYLKKIHHSPWLCFHIPAVIFTPTAQSTDN